MYRVSWIRIVSTSTRSTEGERGNAEGKEERKGKGQVKL